MRLKQIAIFIILVSFFSCERVIDINLNEANPKIVIEANVHNKREGCLVKITRTGSFFKPYTPEIVSNATITLKNQLTTYTFTENTNGNYSIDKIGNLMPTSYSLSVEIDGERYDAESTMPVAIPISYIISEYVTRNIFQDEGYIVNYSFIDPEDENNFYRIRYSLNGELQNDGNDYFLMTDEMFNGKSIQMQIYGIRFEKGDTVEVELMSIDKSTYDYFNTFVELIAQNSMESAAPANPKSNFSNGALGYFSAYSSDKKQIIVGNPPVKN